MGNLKIYGAVACAVLAIAMLAGLKIQQVQISELQNTLADQSEELGRTIAANAGLRASLQAMQVVQAAGDMAIASAAARADKLTRQARQYQNQLSEALRNAKQNKITDPLPLDVTTRLCLLYQAASSASAGDHQGNATAGAIAAAGNSAAAGPDVDTCAAWASLSAEDVTVWAAWLVEHAGLEGSDKRGVREFLQTLEGHNMGKAE